MEQTNAAHADMEPHEEQQNLYLKWRSMNPQQRAEWRQGMSAAQRTELWHRIAADCQKLAPPSEDQAMTKPNGSGEHKPNGASAAEAAVETKQVKRLRRLFRKLPAEQQAAIEAEFHRRDADD